MLCSLQLLAAQDRALFWRLQKSGSTVYLLGSIHLADASFYPLRAEITEAFSQSDVLVVEADAEADDPALMKNLMARGLYPAGDDLTRHISEKTRSLLAEFAQQRGLPLEMLIRQKPAMLTLTLAALQYQELGLTPAYGIDQHFLSLARNIKPVMQLESAQQQIELLLGLDMDDLMLEQALVEMDRAPQLIDELVGHWKSGDEQDLYRLMVNDELQAYPAFEPLMEKLLFQRNRSMADRIREMNRSGGSYFVVVGAAHLLGDRGIIQLLAGNGFSVERI